MTSSPADSPANQSALQEPDSPKTIRGGSGPSSSESFAWFDRDSLSWKTSQGSLLPEWATYSETWPRAGMTVSGKAFRLRLLAPRIYGGGSSSWPTPAAADGDRGSLMYPGNHNPTLLGAARMWPTPAAQEAGGSDEWLETLETVDGEPLEPNQRWYDPATRKHTQKGLSRAVRIWPTPRASDGAGKSSHGRTWSTTDRNLHTVMREMGETKTGGQLNPMWVEWLMGFPEGWTDLEDSATP